MITETENKNYPSEQERALIKKGQNPNNRTPEEIEIIKKDVYPASTFFQRKLYCLVELWRPARFTADYFPFPDARFQKTWSFRHNVSGILCYGTLLPFMFVGIYFLIKERNNAWVFLTFITSTAMGAGAIPHANRCIYNYSGMLWDGCCV
jgi:hypothetical protein